MFAPWMPLLKRDSGKTLAKRWASKTPGNSQIPAFCQILSREKRKLCACVLQAFCQRLISSSNRLRQNAGETQAHLLAFCRHFSSVQFLLQPDSGKTRAKRKHICLRFAGIMAAFNFLLKTDLLAFCRHSASVLV